MPSMKGGKIPMTPKLYEEVATKLADVWGDYAGWAHSVCDAGSNFSETLLHGSSRSCSLRISGPLRITALKNRHRLTVPDSLLQKIRQSRTRLQSGNEGEKRLG